MPRSFLPVQLKRMLLDCRACLYLTIAHPHTKAALPLIGKRPKRQRRRQAPQRQHAFHTYRVPLVLQRVWDQSGDFLYNTTMNAKVSVDTSYDLRLAQPKKKKGEIRRAKRTDFCACIRI